MTRSKCRLLQAGRCASYRAILPLVRAGSSRDPSSARTLDAPMHPVMKTAEERLTQEQRDALWKWRWLGFANSTPAFKASLALLAIAALALLAAPFFG